MPVLPLNATLVKGNPLPQVRKLRYKQDPQRGWTGYYDYDGADQNAMADLQGDFIAAGCESELTWENDKASLTVTDSSGQFTIDSWEVVGNNETRDLFSHPQFVNYIVQIESSSTPSYQLGDIVADLRAALESNQTATAAFDPGAGNTPENSPNPLAIYAGTVVSDFYTRYLQGSTGYKAAQYVLRHKTNVSNRWQVNISDIGIDQLYTPAQFFSEVTNSGLWIFPLPGRLVYKLMAIPDPTTPYLTSQNFLWSWLKEASTETTAANNRVDITTEYSLDLWDAEIYTPFTGS